MNKILIMIVLFVASGTITTQAQYRQTETVWGADNGVYRDDRGEYRWEMRERRVWSPEYRTAGIFGIGSRRVPGHYEMRMERVKAYYGNNKNKKGHPHGMPPGQRKKMDKRYDDRYDDRNDRRDRDDDRSERRDRDDERY